MSRRLSVRHDRFELTHPFRIARGVKTAADVITVTISQDDITGRGEGVPYPRYHENVESGIAAIEQMRPLIEQGMGREALMVAMRAGAARNAVDCALWDLESRLSDQPVSEMIGGTTLGPVTSALTVVIDRPPAMGLAAASIAGAPLIKVKVDASDPKAQIEAVRRAAPKARLIVDPNESWDQRMVEGLQSFLVDQQVALLEQPVPAGEDEWLEGFSPEIPICADESAHLASDLPILLGRYQVINVKLDKTGGLTAALQLAHAARTAGLGLMTGCMVSSSLSIAPALHIAAVSDFVDLDGPIWLAEDRPGGVTDQGGLLLPPSPGFWGTS